ncbi:MAG: DUF4037 domain-containing protein [Acetivibrionales bacterium]
MLTPIYSAATHYSDFEWLLIPEQKLLELTSGEVFYDGLGILNDFRKKISYYPDNVWKYKLAYQWTTLNWELDLIDLCTKRGDILSARLSINETVKRIIGLIFLLNKTYKPGYIKWIHRQFYIELESSGVPTQIHRPKSGMTRQTGVGSGRSVRLKARGLLQVVDVSCHTRKSGGYRGRQFKKHWKAR